MIEVVVNDRLGKKVRVKCEPDDTIGDLKKLIAAQTGTRADKIVLKKWYNIYKDHITLADYEIADGMSLEIDALPGSDDDSMDLFRYPDQPSIPLNKLSKKHLNEIEDDISTDFRLILKHFNVLSDFIDQFSKLDELSSSKIIDTILNGIMKLRDSKECEKQPLEIYSFLMLKIYKQFKSDTSAPIRKLFMACVEKLIGEVNLFKHFSSSQSEIHLFLNCIMKPFQNCIESQDLMKISDFKKSTLSAFTAAVNLYGIPIKTILIQNLTYSEFLTEFFGELLSNLSKERHQIDEVLMEIGNMRFSSNENNSVKSFSSFLVKLSIVCPKEVLKNLSLLINHFDSESSTIRSALLDLICKLTLYCSKSEEESIQKQVVSFLKLIEERFIDINSFVRARALSVLGELCKASAVPLLRRSQLVSLTIERSQDKSSIVRKKAIQLLNDFLKTHPFIIDGGSLEILEIERKLSLIDEKLKELLPSSDLTTSNDAEVFNDNCENQPQEISQELSKETDMIPNLLLQKRYYSDALSFSKQISESLHLTHVLLSSTNKSELLEIMDYCTTAHIYHIPNSITCIKKMLQLVWSNDSDEESKKSIRDHLIDNFKGILFQGSDESDPSKFIEFIADLNASELASFENLLILMQKKKLIHQKFINSLWNIFSLKKSDKSSAYALMLLSIVCDGSNIRNHLDLLIKTGFSLAESGDYLTAKYLCVTLQKLVKSSSDNNKAVIDQCRLPNSNFIFERLTRLIRDFGGNEECFTVYEQSINAIYALAENPDLICEILLKDVYSEAIENTSSNKASSFLLAKLCFIIGHVALQQLIHLERIEKNLRDQNKISTNTKEDNLAAVTASSEDEMSDFLRLVREKHLLDSNSLLGALSNLVIYICGNNKTFSSELVQLHACLSLSKLMTVSRSFCEDNLPLLFTLLEKSDKASIRSNIVIGLGDIFMAFNSVVDSSVFYLTKRLRDDDIVVKRNTFLVLTHLALNGMIKVKGQLHEMALCLESDDPRLAELAKVFFNELSHKENVLYNSFPELLSNLSGAAADLSIEKYTNIMKFILAYISKERQLEGTIQKICSRFRGSVDTRLWIDLSICLSCISYSEKSLKTLMECLPIYQDKLANETVYRHFVDILGKCRKKTIEFKGSLIDEFEAKIADFISKISYNIPPTTDTASCMDIEEENQGSSIKSETKKLSVDNEVKKNTRKIRSSRKSVITEDDE